MVTALKKSAKQKLSPTSASNPHPSVIVCADGRAWDLLAPPASENINILTLIEHISRINRFNGANEQFHIGYNVAQHSIVVCDILRDKSQLVQLYGLVHDLPEAVIGDMTRPLKNTLERICPNFKESWRCLEDLQTFCIYKALGLNFPVPEDIEKLVKWADLTALSTERRDLLAPSQDARLDEINTAQLPPANFHIRTDSHVMAAIKFKIRLQNLLLSTAVKGPATDQILISNHT